MMNNLFSIFDPSTSMNFPMNWISTLIIIMIIPFMYWIIPSRYQFFWFKISNFLMNELYNNFSKKNLKFMILFISIFWFILVSNFMGLFPYIFTPTSHINLTSMLAFPFWLTLMIFGWINLTNHMFLHLVPLGTPLLLSTFMVCIETISNMIRPITLAIRLSANMISGHLLICLLSNTIFSLNSVFPMVAPFLIILLSLETAVALIQSYVFTTLIILYLNEIN
uniref:ATP synthase F0 subunit 6 n=1 Tax=Otobius lagophilus TaxID=2944767 RepID=UPI002238EEBA|nr:ATP synthase F0 subunit 6 [Otobius lagophilus]UYB78383.1 ATP synthase F0 subunit 6 [Otobius lagophilus]UYB78396.1 ATP synthase F0 subunit 6 [Otobius lagophilus]UYL27136.1 ATP synthase F0 subunit 6 [Otobius lagophilus]